YKVLVAACDGARDFARFVWFSSACMGGRTFLFAPNAGDFARTSEFSRHDRSVSLFEKSLVPRRKRVLFFRGSVGIGSPTALLMTALHLPLVVRGLRVRNYSWAKYRCVQGCRGNHGYPVPASALHALGQASALVPLVLSDYAGTNDADWRRPKIKTGSSIKFARCGLIA